MRKSLTYLAVLICLSSSLHADDSAFSAMFREDLRFGGGEDPDYLWMDAQLACNFDVADNGHIFVIDQRNVCILEFDEKGKLVRKLATKGQGPGEYQSVAGLSLLGDGSGVGIDFLNGTLKMSSYDKGTIFRESKVIPDISGFPFKVNFRDKIGVVQLIRQGEGLAMSIEIINRNMKIVQRVHSVPWPQMSGDKFNDPNAWVEHLGNQFKGFWEIGNKSAGFLADGRIVIGDGVKGQYEIWDKEHTHKVGSLKVASKPRPFNEERKQELVDAITTIIFKQSGPALKNIVTSGVITRAIEFANLPPSVNHLYDLIPVAGDVFVAAIDANFAEGTLKLDFIDVAKGRLRTVAFNQRGTFSVFGTRLKFRKGYAYAMVWNEDDENQIVRYKYDPKLILK